MSPESSDLLKLALGLPVEERAALANSLLDSLDDEGSASAEDAWNREVSRRMTALNSGEAVTVPWEEVQRQLRARVDGR